MKKLLYLILFFVSSLLFSQNYHYTSYSDYFDYIGYDKILNNKISKIEIEIDDYQQITAYLNDKAQIEKIEILDRSLNLITAETYFNWNSEFNYTLSSLSDYQTKEFTFMNKITYNYIKKGDKKMSPVSVTQYWLYKDLFWYAEKYNLHNYSNTITRSLNGAIDFVYFNTNLLKSIKTRKVTSEEYSNEKQIMYPKHHIQENNTVDFEYDTSNNLKKVKTYFRNSLTSVKDLIYDNSLLTKIVEKTNYNNSRTELTYSNKLVTKISLTSDLYPEPFNYEITYFADEEKLHLMNSDYKGKGKDVLNNIPSDFLQNYNTDSSLNSIKLLFGEPNKLLTPSVGKNVYSYYYKLKNGYLMIDSKDNIGIDIISIESNGESPYIEIGNSCPIDFYNGEKIKLGFSKFKELMDGSDVDIEISGDRCNKLGFYTRFGGNPCHYKNFLYGNILDSDNFKIDSSKLRKSNNFFDTSGGKADLNIFTDQIIEYIIVSDSGALLKEIHPYGEGIHCSYKY